jgi:hypothetical protein
VGIDLGCEAVPDATTLLKFRRLLETDLVQIGSVNRLKLSVLNRTTSNAKNSLKKPNKFSRDSSFGWLIFRWLRVTLTYI